MFDYQNDTLKLTEDGGYFPRRSCFPIMLANGTDAMLINLIGSMDTHGNLEYSQQLSRQSSFGWYKTGRKDYEFSNMSYGHSVCLADVGTSLMFDKQRISIAEAEQFFDPKKAMVTTIFSRCSHRGGGMVKVKVKTFLTVDHILVKRYEILEVPDVDFTIQFLMGPAVRPSQYDLCIRPEAVEFLHMKNTNGFQFSYRFKKFAGIAATWTDCPASVYEAPENPVYDKIEYSPHRLVTRKLKKGDTITNYTTVIDDLDSGNPQQIIEDLVAGTYISGYREIRLQHEKEMSEYFSKSTVTLPDKKLEFVYNCSLYLMKSLFENETGFMPMGILPYIFENAMFWDSWFASMAWLGSNHGENSRKISKFWKGKLPEAKEVAKIMGVPGARFAWTTNRKKFNLRPEQCRQYHNNGIIVIQIWQCFENCGDIKFLDDMFETMENALIFLVEALVKIENGKAYLCECSGIDESESELKKTDTWTAAVTAKAIRYYLNSCNSLKKTPYRDDLSIVEKMVVHALNGNIDENGVLQSFVGGSLPHWGSLIFDLYPEHPTWRKTLDAMSFYDAELDSYQSHNVISYKDRIFTWTEYWIARIFAEKRVPEAWIRLRKCAKFTNCYGGIPERLFYRGELLLNWFFTSHASYVSAINSLLINRRGNSLSVLDLLPQGWKNIEFENLITHDGIAVSAKMKNGKLEKITLVNTGKSEKTVYLEAPKLTKKLALVPDKSWKWKMNKTKTANMPLPIEVPV